MSLPYRAYIETRVVSASPLQLVHLAYEGAISAISEARAHIVHKDIVERSKAITKAQLIIRELQLSLDFQKGGDIAVQLNRLYDYIQRLVIEGNFRKIEAPLAEAQSLLETLGESWYELSVAESSAAASASSAAWLPAGDDASGARTSFHL
jgi:flagellar secretion chaperone FliS